MIIRKSYRVESSHIVRNCSTDRCKSSVHGHSALIEVFITAKGVDNGQMILDFSLMKGPIKDFIDSFDHTHIIWSRECNEYKDFFKKNNARWIELPVSPSAEMYSLLMFYIIDKIIKNTKFANGETGIELHSVRYHETTTGYAQAFREDLSWITNWSLKDIVFSRRIMEEWRDMDMWSKLSKNQKFINPIVSQQIK